MISVIVPVYNVERYLRECVDSILSQTYEDFEVLLVDDGSTDNSGAICDEYARKDSRVRVIHKPNGGPSSTRNCGIDNARGEWIVFIDSDDLWRSNCLRKLYNYSIKYNLDILRFEYEAVDEHLRHSEVIRHDKSQIQNRLLSNFEIVRYAISGEWFAWLYLIRKEAIEGIRFDECVKFQEDIDFLCRLFATKELRCGYLDKKIYLYRKHTASTSTTPKIENLRGSFNLCDTFYVQSGKVEDSRLKTLYLYNSVMMYYWTLQTLASPVYYAKRKDIIMQLNLDDLQKRTSSRSKKVAIRSIYKPFIRIKPGIGVVLMHIKDRLSECLRCIIRL